MIGRQLVDAQVEGLLESGFSVAAGGVDAQPIVLQDTNVVGIQMLRDMVDHGYPTLA